MELHQLRYFVAAAEAGTISRAAERCRVAQPSLSQQIKKLEDELGVRLFDRLGRGVVLTDEGRALLPRARRVLAEVSQAATELRRDVEEGVGRLAVGAIPTMAPYVLPRVVCPLREQFPRCEVTIREDLTEALLESVADHELDVAILSTPAEHEGVEVEVLAGEEMLVVAPPGHALGNGESISLAALRDEPTVSLHEMHCLGQQISGFCAAKRLRPRVVCRTTQLATVIELVRLGMGVSLIPAMAARHDRTGELVCLRLKGAPPRREIALAWAKGRSRPRTAVRLGELLRRELGAAS